MSNTTEQKEHPDSRATKASFGWILKIRTAMIALVLVFIFGCGQPAARALFVQAKASQGASAPGNAEPANFLVVVTNHLTGAPATDLVQSNFTIINHFSLPGQVCGFSNNITSFNNVGTGAYHIQVGLAGGIPGCAWVQGDYLAQVVVTAEPKSGQAAATLSIK